MLLIIVNSILCVCLFYKHNWNDKCCFLINKSSFISVNEVRKKYIMIMQIFVCFFFVTVGIYILYI